MKRVFLTIELYRSNDDNNYPEKTFLRPKKIQNESPKDIIAQITTNKILLLSKKTGNKYSQPIKKDNHTKVIKNLRIQCIFLIIFTPNSERRESNPILLAYEASVIYMSVSLLRK